MNIPKYQDTNRCRGYAHITFQKLKSVPLALKLDHSYIGSRYVEVKQSTGKKTVVIKSKNKLFGD